MAKRDIVVIGASAGGLKPLQDILAQLPAEFPASVLIVQHMHADSPDHLVEILSQSGPLPAQWSEDRDRIQPGVVHVAPANRHLMISGGQTRVLFGPRESNARPAVDVLFRSAAANYGSRAIGIILSGKFDDGVRGLHAIKRAGGVAIAMDPELADEPSLPSAACREVDVDYVLSPGDIGRLLPRLIEEDVAEVPAPEDIVSEDRVAQAAMTQAVASAGSEADTVSCPGCGGSLQPNGEGNELAYRCRLGHAYSAHSLLGSQQDQLEQTLWVGMRILADRKRVLERLAQDYRRKHYEALARSVDERVSELDQEFRVLRDVLSKLTSPEVVDREAS